MSIVVDHVDHFAGMCVNVSEEDACASVALHSGLISRKPSTSLCNFTITDTAKVRTYVKATV